MIIGAIITLASGLPCIVLGLLIWIKRMVSLIHDYHYKNVKKDDIPAYSRLVGIGLILIGAGICVMGVLLLTETNWWWTPILIGFIAGLAVMHVAQMKYNGSWLS